VFVEAHECPLEMEEVLQRVFCADQEAMVSREALDPLEEDVEPQLEAGIAVGQHLQNGLDLRNVQRLPRATVMCLA
jgi:hypothetical protein